MQITKSEKLREVIGRKKYLCVINVSRIICKTQVLTRFHVLCCFGRLVLALTVNFVAVQSVFVSPPAEKEILGQNILRFLFLLCGDNKFR